MIVTTELRTPLPKNRSSLSRNSLHANELIEVPDGTEAEISILSSKVTVHKIVGNPHESNISCAKISVIIIYCPLISFTYFDTVI